MNLNYKYLIIILFVVILIFIFFPKEENGLIIVSEGDVLPENICEPIKNEEIMVHKLGCTACGVAISRLEELEDELSIDIKYYDMAVMEERDELLSMGFTPKYVPSLISDCKVYTGARSKEEFKEILQNG